MDATVSDAEYSKNMGSRAAGSAYTAKKGRKYNPFFIFLNDKIDSWFGFYQSSLALRFQTILSIDKNLEETSGACV